MADYDSSLPIRTENNGDAVVRLADGTVTSQLLKVNPDGSIDTNTTLTATDLDIRDLNANQDNVAISDGTDTLEVNADGSINAVVTATDLDVRDLSASQDNVAISDGTDTLAINADGSLNATLVGTSEVRITDGTDTLAVNADGSINSVVSATNLDIRDLAFATDKVDVSGSSVTATATDLDIRDLDAAQDNVAISDGTDTLAVNADGSLNAVVTATNLDIRDLAFATDKVDVTGSSVTVTATDLDIRDLTSATDSVAADLRVGGNAVTATNPVPVTLTAAVVGTEVNNHNTQTVAGGATSNHDYAAVGTFLLTQVEASASGKARIAVQIETGVATNTFNTVFVQFNSTANPNMRIELKAPITVAAGVRVRVARRNGENQSQDLYSTICGQES